MKLISANIKKIIELCLRHKVKSMDVFGSILTDRFGPMSDIDLLVDFEKINPDEFDYVTNYFDLRDALETLLGHKVDLIEKQGLRNKYLIDNINRTKQVIYG